MNSDERPALRLARYMREFVGHRTTVVREVGHYDDVLWFAHMPQDPDCRSGAWDDGWAANDVWLEVSKQTFEQAPMVPEMVRPWVDQQALGRADREIPPLASSISVPGRATDSDDEGTPALIRRSITDHPAVQAAYERYRPTWESWAAEHRRREAVQRVYADLFRLRTQVLKQGEVVEVVLGLGLLDLRTEPPVRRHVFVANVHLRFDADRGVIRVEPSGEGALLRIEDEVLDAQHRPAHTDHQTVEEQLDEIGTEIWDKARVHSALRTWTQALGAYDRWSDDLDMPTHVEGAGAVVSFSPALILRKRNQISMRRVYDELIEQLASDAAAVPIGWQSLVEDIGIGEGFVEDTGARPQAPPEVYFPLPTNREQRNIVHAIDRQRGVLVQGPPGTGKSHTIANLISHLLATGQRVLVTAETAQALRVIKDMLPRDLQALCVSLLGHGGDAFAELNRAIQGITAKHASYSPEDSDRITEIERDLKAARRSLSRTDDDLLRLRDEETKEHSVSDGSYRGTASAIARRVASERARYEWLHLPDRADIEDQPPLSNQEMTAWLDIVRRSRTQDAERARLDMRIPQSAELVAPADFDAVVASERSTAAAVEGKGRERAHPAYRPLHMLDPDRRTEIADRLVRLERQRGMLALDRDAWLPTLVRDTVAGRPARWDAIIASNHERLAGIETLRDRVKDRVVVIPTGCDLRNVRADIETALVHLDGGGKWKRLGLFTPRTLRGIEYLRDEVRVDGIGAADGSRLRVARDYLAIELELNELRRLWNGVGAPPLPEDRRQSLAVAAELCSDLECARRYGEQCRALAGEMAAMTTPIPAPDWSNGEAATWLALIGAATLEDRCLESARTVDAAAQPLSGLRGTDGAHPVVAALANAVDRRDVNAYRARYEEVVSIEALREDRRKRRWIEDRIEAVVPGLPGCVASTSDDASWSDRFQAWEDAWRWAVADRWLRSRCDPSHQQDLERSRGETEQDVRRLLTEAAVLRAWDRFFACLSESQNAALRGWLKAVQSMGKGKGRSGRLARLRRQACEYMDECREAIPVWIMPRYLVAEMVNLKPELYDVVIVDEASQLGADSVFLFYIAKKMVVVGDDQQISPYGIGIPDTTTAALQQRYLEGIPHQNAFSPQSSLYDNAFIRFGGRNVVLREHFRCVPEIIQFSNDLCYAPNGTPLDPLRTYPSDRLKPLVVRRVPDGYRTGGDHARNLPEADAIVKQVATCIADPLYADATMGVISLQGEAQARLIERKLLERVDPEVIEERRLLCGDAYAFQGDERDVMFLSMVAAETDDNGERQRIGPLAGDDARRRFNVAASRARDQLWLFHSVDSDSLSPTCMRRRLLDYMLDSRRLLPEEEDARFESDFEREVFQRITQRGYHVRTQVAVGDARTHRYRIDLVVEGRQSRLAVECDGDRWHGLERYEADMARQRDLERAGWQFVRIRGSAFYRNPDEALGPLWKELDRLKISLVDTADGGQSVNTSDVHGLALVRDASREEYETEELEWGCVEHFFREYGCLMIGNPELRWYQESWGALMRAGLTVCTRFEDPIYGYEILKLRAVCLLVMYLGMYQQEPLGPMLGGNFSGHTWMSDYLWSLKVDNQALWEIACAEGFAPDSIDCGSPARDADDEQDEDEKAEVVREMVLELIEEENDPIYQALKGHYGGTPELFVSLWNSRLPLHEVDPSADVINAVPADLTSLVLSPEEVGEKASVYDYVETGMRNWAIDS